MLSVRDKKCAMLQSIPGHGYKGADKNESNELVCERVSVYSDCGIENGLQTAHTHVCVERMLCKRVRGIEYRQKLVNGFSFHCDCFRYNDVSLFLPMMHYGKN